MDRPGSGRPPRLRPRHPRRSGRSRQRQLGLQGGERLGRRGPGHRRFGSHPPPQDKAHPAPGSVSVRNRPPPFSVIASEARRSRRHALKHGAWTPGLPRRVAPRDDSQGWIFRLRHYPAPTTDRTRRYPLVGRRMGERNAARPGQGPTPPAEAWVRACQCYGRLGLSQWGNPHPALSRGRATYVSTCECPRFLERVGMAARTGGHWHPVA